MKKLLKKIAGVTAALFILQSFITVPSASAVPATPQLLSVSVNSISGGTMDVKLLIQNPSDASIVGYQYSTDGGSNWKECNSADCNWTTGSTQLILQKLSSANASMSVGSTYTISLKACSGGSPGNSGNLSLTSCSGASDGFVYKAGTADAPTSVTGSSPTVNSIDVSWTTPASNGGAAISDYTIQYSSNSGTSWTTFSHTASTTTSITVTGLTSATAYIFRVAAVNSQGTGSYSLNSSSVTTLSPPSSDSRLNSAVVKGVTVSLMSGSDTSTINTSDSSTVTLTQIQASDSATGSYSSTFTASDSGGASVRVVLYSSGQSTSNFNSDATYANQAISNNSFFIIRIISSDTTSTSFYRINVVVQAPSITTSSSITSGAANPTVVVQGNYFKNSATSSDFTFTAGVSGLSLSSITVSSTTSITLNLSGTATPGTITVRALATAYTPEASGASNTLSIEIASAPSSGGGGGGSAPVPVYVPKPPTISSISAPEVCAVKSQLVIKGTNFSGSTVKVDDLSAQVLSSSATELQVALPSAPVGTKTLTVTNSDGSATTSLKYEFVDSPIYVDYVYPSTYVNKAFSYTFKATDATKYEISGTLPAGLALNSATGELSGTPTTGGTYEFIIIASNLCDQVPLIVYMYVDKAIPKAFTCSVAFNILRSDNISDVKLANLKTCLSPIPTLSPKYVDPIIFLSGGIPSYLTEEEALTHPRYLPIIEVIQNLKVNAQIYLGAFEGSLSSVQVNVYWPEPDL